MSETIAKEIIEAVLSDAKKLTKDLHKLKSICEDNGILLDETFSFVAMKNDPIMTLRGFYKDLAKLPVVKIAAKMAAKKHGLSL